MQENSSHRNSHHTQSRIRGVKVKESGLEDTTVIGIYIFYNLIYALFAYPLGILADRFGLKKMFIFGLGLFAVVYLGMAFFHNKLWFYALFFIYGIYASATEGVSKAWISNITDKKDTATAIGTYMSFQSVCTMGASALTGFLWFRFGSGTAFIISGLGSILVLSYLSFKFKEL